MLIQYIRSYPPYWKPFLHPQPEDEPCRGDRDPLITWRYGVPLIANQTHYHRLQRITLAGGSHHKHVSKFAIKMQILIRDKEPTNFVKVLRQILQVRGWWNVLKIQQLSSLQNINVQLMESTFRPQNDLATLTQPNFYRINSTITFAQHSITVANSTLAVV
jgi:hypothetical protein